MNEDRARAFLKALNTKNIQKKDKYWLTASCPLARWTHKSGKDSNPSFGFTIKEGEPSRFNCFSCQSGSAVDLLYTIQFYAQKDLQPGVYDFLTAINLADEEVSALPQLSGYREFKVVDELKLFEEWPEHWLDTFFDAWNAPVAREYLLKRKVTEEQAVEFRLKFDTMREMIVSPYFDVDGRFAGARGRSIDDTKEGFEKHHDYTFLGKNNAALVWYNERVLNLKGPTVVVEGQFDLYRTAPAYLKTTANLTAKPSPAKWGKLAYSGGVILIPDNDETGEKTKALYAINCRLQKVRMEVLQLPEDVKDAGECATEYLHDRIHELLPKF